MILGLSFVVGIYTYIITQRSVEATENYSAYYAYTNARNIAHSAVNNALREIELKNSSPYEGTFGLGRFRVDTTSAGDTVNMTARSWFMDTSYVMYLTLEKYAKPFPDIESALTINVKDVNFVAKGSGEINGFDHDMDGNLLGSGGLPGVTVLSPVESTTVAGYGTTVTGDPVPIKSDATMPDPSKYVDEYIFNADYYYPAGTYSSVTWGSESNPVIVYCDGTLGNGVKFTGNVKGWGILVVKGKLWLGGNFLFHGLVIVYEDVEVNKQFVTGAGTPDILGAILVAGPQGSTFELKGNPKIAYSSEAIEYARDMAKLRAYKVLRWWE